MKLKLAKRMHKARKRELDRARATLARVDTQIRELELQLEHARQEVRALHASSVFKSTELERAHLQCKELEQDLQDLAMQRQKAHTQVIDRYHHSERGSKVLEKATQEHKDHLLLQEQRCNDDRSPEHLKKLA